MILYIDTFITDVPRVAWKNRKFLPEDIRKNSLIYALPKKLDVAKYTLASYALYPWSHVFIRYELEDPNEVKEFDAYILKLFPRAVIWHERSDSQADWKRSWEVLKEMNDEWIFFAPHVNHPLMTSNPNFVVYINRLLKKATQYKKDYKFVSIAYSHFSEYINLAVKGSPQNIVWGRGVIQIAEDDIAKAYVQKGGDFTSIQIIDQHLFRTWFVDSALQDRRVIRVEDVESRVKIPEQLVIVPKEELWEHFDGYEHMLGAPNAIFNDVVPPLFLPPGFFDNKIKIAYGYDTYRKGWVNINPLAKQYSFRDLIHGTDVKWGVADIPLFWKSHIARIDIKKKIDQDAVDLYREIQRNNIINPWRWSKLDRKTVRFFIRLWIYAIFVKLNLDRITLRVIKRFRFLQRIVRWIL